MGVCASPDGVALPVGPTVPVPTAYFPLTNGSTYSWPIPEYWAYNTSTIKAKQTKFVKDSYFGTVVQCNASVGGNSTSWSYADCSCVSRSFMRILWEGMLSPACGVKFDIALDAAHIMHAIALYQGSSTFCRF